MEYTILTEFPYFEKINKSSLDHLAVCVYPVTTFLRVYWRGNMFTEPLPSIGVSSGSAIPAFRRHGHIAFKSCWVRCFLCGPCRIKHSICSERELVLPKIPVLIQIEYRSWANSWLLLEYNGAEAPYKARTMANLTFAKSIASQNEVVAGLSYMTFSFYRNLSLCKANFKTKETICESLFWRNDMKVISGFGLKCERFWHYFCEM
jgi:hypothetical protein